MGFEDWHKERPLEAAFLSERPPSQYSKTKSLFMVILFFTQHLDITEFDSGVECVCYLGEQHLFSAHSLFHSLLCFSTITPDV